MLQEILASYLIIVGDRFGYHMNNYNNSLRGTGIRRLSSAGDLDTFANDPNCTYLLLSYNSRPTDEILMQALTPLGSNKDVTDYQIRMPLTPTESLYYRCVFSN